MSPIFVTLKKPSIKDRSLTLVEADLQIYFYNFLSIQYVMISYSFHVK